MDCHQPDFKGHIRTLHFQKIGPSPVESGGDERITGDPLHLHHCRIQDSKILETALAGAAHRGTCSVATVGRDAGCFLIVWKTWPIQAITRRCVKPTLWCQCSKSSFQSRRFKYYAQLPVVTQSWPSTCTKDFSWAGHDAASLMPENRTNHQTESVGPSSKCFSQFWKAIGVVLLCFVVLFLL